MKIKILIIVLLCISIVWLNNYIAMSTSTRAKKQLRIGELWHEEEEIPYGGWEKSFVWPGNHWRRSNASENLTTNGTARGCGMGYGIKDYTRSMDKIF